MRPGFIHGTRRVGSVKIPLGLVGSPMQMVKALHSVFASLATQLFLLLFQM